MIETLNPLSVYSLFFLLRSESNNVEVRLNKSDQPRVKHSFLPFGLFVVKDELGIVACGYELWQTKMVSQT